MKYIALVAAIAAATACTPAETEAPAEVGATTVEPEIVAEPTTTAADGGPSFGTFRITNAEGEVSTEVINSDGTFTSTDEDGEVTNGTWEQRSPEQFCTQSADESEMSCYDEAVGEDGVWRSTDPEDGEVSTVERVADG